MAHLPIRGGQQDLKPKAELSGKKGVAHSLCSSDSERNHQHRFDSVMVANRTGVEIPASEGTGQAKACPARSAIEMQ
ncbi:hypothetical protein DZC76_09460 [Pseudomonas sp. phDV1]|nr:hypothetical protein DZC76_09460 [Pseudomonas sp. phDV1]